MFTTWRYKMEPTCVNCAVDLHGHIDAGGSIRGDIHGQTLFTLCWREESAQ